jgi:hypothetical protein
MDGQKSTSSSGKFRIGEDVASGLGAGKLESVVVTTKTGAIYRFPDMPRDELERVLPESGRINSSMPALMMVNASVSVLTIPFRIIKTIRVGEEVLWACPA